MVVVAPPGLDESVARLKHGSLRLRKGGADDMRDMLKGFLDTAETIERVSIVRYSGSALARFQPQAAGLDWLRGLEEGLVAVTPKRLLFVFVSRRIKGSPRAIQIPFTDVRHAAVKLSNPSKGRLLLEVPPHKLGPMIERGSNEVFKLAADHIEGSGGKVVRL